MTPAERVRLAEALTKATGQAWRPSQYLTDPAVEGATREFPRIVAIMRSGPHAVLVTSDGLRLRFGGRYVGRGWLDRLVADAVVEIRAYDVGSPRKNTSARDTRRAVTFRRILHPDSGASESERLQARRHLARLAP